MCMYPVIHINPSETITAGVSITVELGFVTFINKIKSKYVFTTFVTINLTFVKNKKH